jgi:hypothetical protein
MARRYAEGTQVSVESSRGEITGILAKHGVVRMGWFTEPEADVLQFELHGHAYRLHIVRPTVADVKAMHIADGRDWSRVYDPASKVNAEWKRRWRANVLLLKAKLEFADGMTSTVERELMPYMVLKDGRTLEAVITDGSLPLLAAKNA